MGARLNVIAFEAADCRRDTKVGGHQSWQTTPDAGAKRG
jgi:hypothetical protein